MSDANEQFRLALLEYLRVGFSDAPMPEKERLYKIANTRLAALPWWRRKLWEFKIGRAFRHARRMYAEHLRASAVAGPTGGDR